MKKFGLIGYPLSHTFSPGYFKSKFEREGILACKYEAYPLESVELFKELYSDELVGLNVTIPYKEQVIPHLDQLSEEAAEIGAVNTIHFIGGKTIGYNSDVYGFSQSLINWIGEDNLPQKALILGSGGASKAVGYVCKQLNIQSRIVSRKEGYLNYKDLDDLITVSYTHLTLPTKA